MVTMKQPQTEFDETREITPQEQTFAVKMLTQLEAKFDNHIHCRKCLLPFDKPAEIHDPICDKCRKALEPKGPIIQDTI